MMDLEVEIFATGQWNGMTFEIEDLNMMASSFSALMGVHKVPLKFGHNDEQPFTDGQPALGWVEKVWVSGSKLMAKFVDIPDLVYTAMENKLYKHVSVELDMGVEHKGVYHTWVLSGVALLGADIPAVNTLADLTNYMSKDEDLTFKKRVAFTAVNIKREEEIDMGALEDAQAKIATLEAEAKLKDEQTAKFAKDKAASDSKVIEFEAKEKQRAEDAEKLFFATARTDMTGKLEALVKSETITPAQREKFTADFKDDKEVISRLNFALEILGVGAKGSKGLSAAELAKGDNVNDEDKGKLPDEILMNRINAVIANDPKMSFSAARNIAMKADPELAKSYNIMNMEA